MNGQNLIPQGLRRLFVVSAVLHLLIGLLLFFGGDILSHASPERPLNVMTTKLVKLGKKRDENMLPRIEEAPPPPPPKVAPTPMTAPTAKVPAPKQPPPSTETSANNRLKQLSTLSNALKRARQTAESEGDPEGDPDGEVSQAHLAMIGNKYTTEIYKCAKRNWRIEGLSQARVKKLQTVLTMRVQADGRFTDIRVSESSGNAIFDAAAERALQRCGKVSPPPEVLRERVGTDGIVLGISP
ncbi:MAG: TonB family protein [Myxococcota bacterium]